MYSMSCLQGDKLADYMLMIGVALILLPLVIVLSVWSAIGVEFHANAIPNEVSNQIITGLGISLLACTYYAESSNYQLHILLS